MVTGPDKNSNAVANRLGKRSETTAIAMYKWSMLLCKLNSFGSVKTRLPKSITRQKKTSQVVNAAASNVFGE